MGDPWEEETPLFFTLRRKDHLIVVYVLKIVCGYLTLGSGMRKVRHAMYMEGILLQMDFVL